MPKYKIISYKKIEQNFMQSINSMDDMTGTILEPYDIELEVFTFFGLIRNEIVKRVQFPRGFNHQRELTKGREWIWKTKN